MIDLPTRILGWAGGLAFVAALLAALYLTGKMNGRDAERAKWQERQIVAERAARQTEADLGKIAEASAKRIAQKEAQLDAQAQRQAVVWRQMLADMPRCRVPRAVGGMLDAAAGSVPATAEIPGSISPDPDEAALAATIDLAETLDRVRENYAICRVNAERLTEARGWYTDLRTRVNSGAQP